MSMLIEGLELTIGKNRILRGIDLEISEGEFFSLLGKSGSGKSTLLKTIAGLMQEDCGSISLGGKTLYDRPPQDRGVAVVFQDLRLFPNMTVGENVAYPLRLAKVRKRERAARAEELLSLVRLDGFSARHVNELSGGQAQRVAIARALAANPKVLLLDEPFSALDENLRESMRVLILGIHRKMNLTIIMVTHNQNEALSLSDRIAVMDEGRILQVGTPREIYHNPATLEIALYLADASVLRGQARDGAFSCEGLSIPFFGEDGNYWAVVNSSAVSLSKDAGGQKMTVQDVRYRGHSVELVLECAGASVRTEVEEGCELQRGDKVCVDFDPDSLIYFPD